MGEEGEDRRFRPLHDQHGKTVGQLLDGDPLFKRGDVLGANDRYENQEAETKGKDARTGSIHSQVPGNKVKGWDGIFSNETELAGCENSGAGRLRAVVRRMRIRLPEKIGDDITGAIKKTSRYKPTCQNIRLCWKSSASKRKRPRASRN